MDTTIEPLRIGIAGTGFISAVHASCAEASPNVELVAIASARGRASRERVGPLGPSVRLSTMEELLAADEVEAVVVCTRTSDHAGVAAEALRRGKHLLLEKPGASTLQAQDAITAAAAKRPELVARVAYQRRHDARFRELARVVASGTIGEPFAVRLTSREDFPPSEDDAAAGGFIMDVGVHDFDTARWLLGRDPGVAYALVHNPVYRHADLDNAYVSIGLQGAVATTHLSRTSKLGMDITCEVVGTEGSALLAGAPAAPGSPSSRRRRASSTPWIAGSGSATPTRRRSTTSVRRAAVRRRPTRPWRTIAGPSPRPSPHGPARSAASRWPSGPTGPGGQLPEPGSSRASATGLQPSGPLGTFLPGTFHPVGGNDVSTVAGSDQSSGSSGLFTRQASGLVRELGVPAATAIALASVAVVNTFINFTNGLISFNRPDMVLPLILAAAIWFVAMFAYKYLLQAIPGPVASMCTSPV